MSKISPGTMTAAIFAILLGLAGAYTVRHYLNQKPVETVEETPPAAKPKVFVPVAARKLMVGQELTINDIAIRSFSAEEFPKSEFAGRAYMPNTDQIMGRMIAKEVPAGAVFLPDSFYPDKMGPGISQNLKPGFRAITVPIQNIGAIEGFARPGSLVDVLFRADSTADSPEVTVTLLEGVEVLAVGQSMLPGQVISLDTPGKKSASVTLAVEPRQAQALKVVEGRGELSLSLRNADLVEEELQTVSHGSPAMTLTQLLGVPEKQRPKQIEIFRGGQRETVSFGGDAPAPTQFDQLLQSPLVRGTTGPSLTQTNSTRTR